MFTVAMTICAVAMISIIAGFIHGTVDWDGIKRERQKREREKNKKAFDHVKKAKSKNMTDYN